MIARPERLVGVDYRLVAVVERAAKRQSVLVVEGLRTLARQRELVAKGASRTLNSRHLTGHAVDLAPWNDKDGDKRVDQDEIDWKDLDGFRRLAKVMMEAAEEEGVVLVWGGTFSGFLDGPHFELHRRVHP